MKLYGHNEQTLEGPVDDIREINGKYRYYRAKLGHAPNRQERLKIINNIYADLLKTKFKSSKYFIDYTTGLSHPADIVWGAVKTTAVAPFKALGFLADAAEDALPWYLQPSTFLIGAAVIYFAPMMLGRYAKARA